jgi:DNA mismatch repair protein MutS
MTNFDENIIKPGVSEKLDSIIAKYNENNELFYSIKNYFNKFIQDHEKSAETDYIKVHETEKSGLSLQITAKRSQTMKIILNNLINSSTDGVVVLPNGNHKLNLKDIKFTKASASNMEIDCSLITKLCTDLFILKESMNNEIAITYISILSKIEDQWYNCLENFAIYTSKIDVLQCKTYIAKTYNYCQPEIASESNKSFVNASDLRHCLIEHIQQNELYVTNDISLGANSECDGILLYGTNAVGKTSLIRALGISVIMAQSGLYVPCSKFVYKPYTAIFSRILGNDNLFKGLSTFAVEMSELRTILKMSDENSLILGDELCSGTETESALSIFVAGLMNLHNKRSSYIFATHFHEIIHYDEIESLSRLKMKHMSVSYDRENDCLVYDRKLKDGSGPRIYGLEVCKSLYLGDEFLESAYAIRNKYYPETRGELSNNPTIYNSKKIKGMCELCGVNIGEEIHHLKHQKNADKNGFIGTHHKNHIANLITVCEECHDNFHSEQNDEYIRKKTTKGYKLEKS